MAFAGPCLVWRPYGRSYEDGTDALEDSQWIRRCPIRHGKSDSRSGHPVCTAGSYTARASTRSRHRPADAAACFSGGYHLRSDACHHPGPCGRSVIGPSIHPGGFVMIGDPTPCCRLPRAPWWIDYCRLQQQCGWCGVRGGSTSTVTAPQRTSPISAPGCYQYRRHRGCPGRPAPRRSGC